MPNVADTVTLFSINLQTIEIVVQIVVSLAVGAIGWFIRVLLNQIRDIKADAAEEMKSMRAEYREALMELRTEGVDSRTNLPANYVNKLEFSRTIDGLLFEIHSLGERIDATRDKMLDKLDRIGDKLDNKQDKT